MRDMILNQLLNGSSSLNSLDESQFLVEEEEEAERCDASAKAMMDF